MKHETVVFIDSGIDGYGVDQCGHTMTVGELIDILRDFEEDAKIYIRNDGGYTYGRITEGRIEDDIVTIDDDED